MGRIGKAILILSCCILLTACNKPGEIDPNLHYVDVNTPGEIPNETDEVLKHDGSDNWGIDPGGYGDLSDPNNMDKYLQDLQEAKAQYYENLPGLPDTPSNSTESTGEQITKPIPDFSTVSSYSDSDLLTAYGNADAYGFYDEQKHHIYSRTGQVIEEISSSYITAVNEMRYLLGEPDVEFVFSDREETYWFTPSYVYSIASSLGGTLVTKSQSNYLTTFTTSSLGYGNGTPYHEDYYNIIWRTGDTYTCINRFTNEEVIC